MRKIVLFVALLTSSLACLWAQGTVSGRVTSADSGQPMEGVTVVVSGTTTGVLTDDEGRFSVTLPAGGEELVFAFIGFTKVTETVAGRSSINVSLKEDIMQLDEVVVTALGISREKKSLGYAVQDLDGSELVGSGEINLIQSLASKAAGVQIIGSGGTPGASSKILIRGNSTFTGENQPLMVVDGVPIDNDSEQSAGRDYPFNANLTGINNSNRGIDINPDDVESVTILKGPAAAALYGVRAGAGAIVITTKRGSSGFSGKPKVTLRSSIEFSEVNKLPELQSTYAQGNPDANGVPQFSTFDPGPDNTFFTGDDVSTGTSASWGPKISDDPNLQSYDNIGEFFQTGIAQNHNLAFSGGNENTSFRLSLGYLNQQGIVPNTSFNRASVRLTSDTRLSDVFKVGSTINFINSQGSRAQNGSNLSGVMLTLTRTPASFDLAGTGDDGYLYPNGQQRQYFFVYDNPYFTAFQNSFTDNVNRVLGNVFATYEPTSWLTATYRIGGDMYSDQREQVYAVGAWEPDNAPLGEIRENTLNYRELYADLLVSANYDFTEDFNASLTVGNNLNVRYRQDLFARGRNIAIPGFDNWSATNDLYASEFEEQVRTAAFFFDANFSWKEMLYLNVTGRNEWASTFGDDQNNFFYPSASLSFAFSELIPENKLLSFGKLRLARAQAGINPDPYLTRTLFVAPFFTDGFTNGLSFPYLGQSGFGYGSSLGNAFLQPEKVIGTEIGLDLRLFLGRLNIDVTLYEQTSSDLLVLRPLAGSSGFRFVNVNFGSMVNRGIEAIISGDPIKTKNFTWNIVANFTRNVNEVLTLADGVDEINVESAFSSIGSFAIKGQPYGALFGTRWVRNDDGDLVINEATGLPGIEAERGRVGNPFPDFLLGIRNSFSYKGLVLTALLDIRQGGDVWCGTCARLNRLGRTEISADRERTYVIPGVIDNGDGTYRQNDVEIDAIDYYQRFVGDNGAAVEQSVFDGSWLRLREVGLSYQFKMSPRSFVKQLDVALTGRNLWLSTDYPGVDPETSLTGSSSNVSGFDYFNMPGSRSYSAAVTLGF